MLDGTTGWAPAGTGEAVSYPTTYLAVIVLLLGAYVLSPPVAQLVYVFAVAAACCFAGVRLAGRSASNATRLAAALFATFNPWVYTETVAGHFYMIIAYAATMLLFAEIVLPGKRSRRLACIFLAIVSQIQFVFVPAIIFVVRFVRNRERLPLLVAAILLLPAFLGIVLGYDGLIGIPYLLEWERQSSVAPFDAVRLLGYFAHYGSHIVLPMSAIMDVALALAAAGLLGIRFRTKGPAIAAFGALVIAATVYAMGSRGPIAAWFEWIVLAVPQSGVFRELYDLLAYTAIGYVALLALVARRFSAARWAFLLVGLCLAVTWFAEPPSTYTVALADLPPVPIDAAEHSRYALFPAFQPFTEHGRGSGLDPDAFLRPGDRAPLNEFMPSYPAATALAAFALDCDSSKLAALSVTYIAVRPWLQPADARMHRPDGTQCAGGPLIGQRVVPELGISNLPDVGSLDSNAGAGNVFFGDAAPRGERSQYPVRAGRRFADPALDWVDARLAFATDPQIGQAFGGAMTRSATAVLPVRPGVPALVFVKGSLLNLSSRVVLSANGGYRWLAIDSTTNGLRCNGFCVVALQADVPRDIPLNPKGHAVFELPFDSFAPFFIRARLPSGPPALLRYNVTYNTFWLAFTPAFSALKHLRIDAATNGWQLPERSTSETVYLLNAAAGIECLSIVFATACATLLVWNAARRSIRAKH